MLNKYKYKNINPMNQATFENEDLVDILNFQTIHKPLHKRIQQDFSKKNKVTHISSPLSDEEFIVPMPIGKSTTDLYPHLRKEKMKKRTKRNRTKRTKRNRTKTHVTHKIYKKPKSSSKSSSKSKKSTISIGDLL